MGRAVAESAVDGHAPSSWECPTAISIPVLMGDNWPFSGCRTVVEDVVEDVAGAQAVLVLCAMEEG